MTAAVVLWLCLCVLARSERERETCAVGTLLFLAVLIVAHVV